MTMEVAIVLQYSHHAVKVQPGPGKRPVLGESSVVQVVPPKCRIKVHADVTMVFAETLLEPGTVVILNHKLPAAVFEE